MAAVVVATVMMEEEEEAVGSMGFNGNLFLIDPESVPRVVSLSIRSSIVGKKLYVGNLSYNVNESDLETMFTGS